MKGRIKGKKGIFFDIGYTLLQMNTGDWRATEKFYEYVPRKYLASLPPEQVKRAFDAGYAVQNQRRFRFVRTEEEEFEMNVEIYKTICDGLSVVDGLAICDGNAICDGIAVSDGSRELRLGDDAVREIAYDRTYNMDNYLFYEGLTEVFGSLRESYRIGIISDTWPTADRVLKKAGIYHMINSFTYSCYLGVTKPDPLMYTHALSDIGLRGDETVFIDDFPANLTGAGQHGITPILILTKEKKGSSDFIEIEKLTELLEMF